MFLHVSVILLTGGVPAPILGGYFFRGGGIFFGGVPAPIFFWGGACSNFLGGGIFWGVPAPNFRGGIFFGGAPIFGIRSPFGRYASYWNAFLFLILISLVRY